MRIAMAQMKNCGSREANLKKSLALLRQAAEEGADLILYPEVQLSEFFAQYPGRDISDYGMALESETVKAFQSACRRFKTPSPSRCATAWAPRTRWTSAGSLSQSAPGESGS